MLCAYAHNMIMADLKYETVVQYEVHFKTRLPSSMQKKRDQPQLVFHIIYSECWKCLQAL